MSDGAPLIGAEDMETPEWARGYSAVATARVLDVATAAPRTAWFVARNAWQTAPSLTLTAATLQLLSGVLAAFGLLATADVFTSLLQQGPTPARIVAALPSIAVVVAALAGRGLMDAATAVVQGVLLPRVEQRAQQELHEAVIGVDLVAFDDADFTELIDRASMHGVTRLHVAGQATGDLISGVVAVLAAIGTVGFLHLLLIPVVLLAAVPAAWAAIRMARMSFDSITAMSSNTRRMHVTSRLICDRGSAAEIRAFTTQPTLLAEHRRIGEALTAEAVRLARSRTLVGTAGQALGGIGTGIAFAVLALLIYLQVLPLALAGTAAIAMRAAGGAVSRIVLDSNQLYEAGYHLRVFRSALLDAAARRRPPATAPTPAAPATITATDLTFRYPGQDVDALTGVTVTLRRGETVALVGENGSGKSTLAKLLTGLYLPTSGTVAWSGADTRELDVDAMLDRVAVVLQDTLRWPMTAENNVRIGRLDRLDPGGAALADAAERSGAVAVADDLPDGWGTVLSREFQGGRDLSGGQWQRIAVARGLYRDAPVVVADEPTAALDARAEHAVFAALRELAAASTTTDGRITVLVTHRLANVRDADQILVLEKGRIVEHGRHADLIARRGLYQELFALQAQAYGDDPGH